MDREMWATRGRYALAATLGLTILGLTYVLFDPDLGTPVPLFQEFTCTGRLRVVATDPGGNATVRVPEMALRMQALAGDTGMFRPAYFSIQKRERGEEWGTFYELPIESGEHLIFVAPTSNLTEIQVLARDLEGEYCAGRSPVITAPSSSWAPGSP